MSERLVDISEQSTDKAVLTRKMVINFQIKVTGLFQKLVPILEKIVVTLRAMAVHLVTYSVIE